MREGILTEREWLRQVWRVSKRRPPCWGAQYVTPPPQPKLHQRRKYRQWLVLSLALGVMGLAWYIISLCQIPPSDFPIMPALSQTVERPPKSTVRINSAVAYSYPQLPVKEVTFPREELLRGNIMLLNREYPLPHDVPGANTVSIATFGKGIVPVHNLDLKSGRQTIDALYQFFLFARQKGIEGLGISRGTLSEAEQRELQLERVKVYAASMSLQEAVEKARQEVDDPRTSDYQQQYTVEIRLYTPWEGAADQRPLALTEQGRFLLTNAWRYGFIRRFPNENNNPYKAYQFRYVGVAHSTAMTYLDLELEAYLELLHEKQVIFIHDKGTPKYLILCLPVTDGYASFPVPENASYEAGYDNMGYAVVACTFAS